MKQITFYPEPIHKVAVVSITISDRLHKIHVGDIFEILKETREYILITLVNRSGPVVWGLRKSQVEYIN